MSFPLLDLGGFSRRSILPADFIATVEDRTPGFVAKQVSLDASWIDSRLRKRYGRSWQRSSLPFGASPAPLIATGTSPPAIALSGIPTLGSIELVIRVTTPGPLGTAIVQWSADGGVTFVAGLATASSVALGTTGITAAFAPATYGADNAYAAAPPVPEIILGWLTKLGGLSVARKHRLAYNNEKGVELLEKDADMVRAEVTEAANSDTGLFDIPTNEDSDSAVTTGGMLSYSESSPYVSADRQEFDGRHEDARGFGTFGS